MKLKLLTIISILSFFTVLKAQTSISSSTNVLCVGQSATLTASHDFLHNWCYWSTGGSGTSIVVSPAVTTTYSVTCYDADANQAGASYVQNVAICTGIKQELANTIIEIFPNPASDAITVFGLGKNTTVEIYNSLGAVCYTGIAEDEIKEISLNGYKPGIYFIKIKADKQEFTRKIIKQ